LSGFDKGFVGGTNDNTGLTHIGAREYHAGFGRFVSVDPVMDLADPQQWNAYAYSNNSPVTFSDPTGLWCDSCNNGNGWDQVDGMKEWNLPPAGPTAEQIRYSVLVGTNTNPAYQPYIADVQVPTFEQLKQIRLPVIVMVLVIRMVIRSGIGLSIVVSGIVRRIRRSVTRSRVMV
jgi:RHS repeat-associated protein